jgi:hypothetical protein
MVFLPTSRRLRPPASARRPICLVIPSALHDPRLATPLRKRKRDQAECVQHFVSQ